MVRPKKHLGQHFLKDQQTARKITEALTAGPGESVLEIGPGTGVLTQFLVQRPDISLRVIEIDRESVAFLQRTYPALAIVEGDFLEIPWEAMATGPVHIIGNFPYNISSQIFFRVLAHRQEVRSVVCMLQKEVADRIAEKEGSKTYGILSVLLQAYYTVDYLFKVPPGVFHPPPKVMSAVIRLVRNEREHLGCDEALFQKVVKQGFNNRRKTLRNALKVLAFPADVYSLPVMDKRAEQLSVDDFINLTRHIQDRERAARI
ncbi:MAG: 16S rRNA (adenine(1518)-N(6)/adenine(1519)-N(6))-dimethyltransferase RsmA [Cyclobacteriaceae bacterium]|jgi:16S rRNA (adenine1518-N6/adenine1519-N6)-dimethyltransferase|nr:16S rRNA (adenine(1518)-N(6)/adenine(1519)-N(6))-dimethyltransferase RsmA [Cyclobacteriaceae bacterium]